MQTFIQKLKWMSETVFMELFALAACLPGPTSTQVSFALGAVKKGIPGGLLGGLLFQHPGLIMMTIVGVGAANFLHETHHWTSATVDGAALAASQSPLRIIPHPITNNVLRHTLAVSSARGCRPCPAGHTTYCWQCCWPLLLDTSRIAAQNSSCLLLAMGASRAHMSTPVL